MQFYFCDHSSMKYILFVHILICLVDGGAGTHEEHAFTGEAEIDVTDDGKEEL